MRICAFLTSLCTFYTEKSNFGSSFNPGFNIGALDRGVVDATIWVSPLCTSRATKFPEVCTPMFKAAACYPYCMAARLRDSGADGLVLYNAPDWHERVHLMKRDCIIETPVLAAAVAKSASGTTTSGGNKVRLMPNGTLSSTDTLPGIESAMSNDVIAGSSVVSKKWDPNTMGCVQSNLARSMVKAEEHPTYTSTSSGSNRKRTFRSILMKGQPFAYAGLLMCVCVRVHLLSGMALAGFEV